MRFAGQMPWSREVYIVSSLVCKKHMRKVKTCMTIESGPEWIVTLFFAEYGLALIQCSLVLKYQENIYSQKCVQNGYLYLILTGHEFTV
jgi:hypothetical protein